jgi:hypothetical protein
MGEFPDILEEFFSRERKREIHFWRGREESRMKRNKKLGVTFIFLMIYFLNLIDFIYDFLSFLKE